MNKWWLVLIYFYATWKLRWYFLKRIFRFHPNDWGFSEQLQFLEQFSQGRWRCSWEAYFFLIVLHIGPGWFFPLHSSVRVTYKSLWCLCRDLKPGDRGLQNSWVGQGGVLSSTGLVLLTQKIYKNPGHSQGKQRSTVGVWRSADHSPLTLIAFVRLWKHVIKNLSFYPWIWYNMPLHWVLWEKWS